MKIIYNLFLMITIFACYQIDDVNAQTEACKFPLTPIWKQKLFEPSEPSPFVNVRFMVPLPNQELAMGKVGDFEVLKVDSNQNVLWQKEYKANFREQMTSIIEAPNGGLLLGGNSGSGIRGEKSEPNRGEEDYWLILLDADGNKVWDKTLGGNQEEYLTDMISLDDGSFIIGGYSYSDISGDKTEQNYISPYTSGNTADYWIVKVDADGKKLWDRTIGGGGQDFCRSIIELPNGEVLVGGTSASNISGDKSQNRYNFSTDYWVLKLDSNGNVIWDKTFGGDDREDFKDMILLPDGNCLLAGDSRSNISGDKSENARSSDTFDYWLVKIDPHLGNKLWDKTLGGEGGDNISEIIQSNNDNILLVGDSNSGSSGDKSSQLISEEEDFWLVQIDKAGNILWDISLNSEDGSYFDATKTLEGDYYVKGSKVIYKISDSGTDLKLKLFLLNPRSQENPVVREINDGDIIDLDEYNQDFFNLQLNNFSSTGSIKLEVNLTGPIQLQKTFNITPYTIFGDFTQNLGNLLTGEKLLPGKYTLTATPFCGDSLTEKQGKVQTFNFEIIKERTSNCSITPSITDENFIGIEGRNTITDLLLLSNGDYLVTGKSITELDGNHECNTLADTDAWLFKFDENDQLIWEQTIEENTNDFYKSLLLLPDGNILTTVFTSEPSSFDATLPIESTTRLIKISPDGEKIWERILEKPYRLDLSDMINLPDGNILIVASASLDTANYIGDADYYIAKLDQEGNKLWDKIYGGTKDDFLQDAIVLSDGNVLLGGYSRSSNEGDKSEVSRGREDYWIIKIDLEGNKLWNKTIGGNLGDQLQDMLLITDGNILLAGNSNSGVGNEKSDANLGSQTDIWVVKIDINGSILWDKTIGGNNLDEISEMILLDNQNIVIGGFSLSEASAWKSVSSLESSFDFWAISMDENGNRIWDKTTKGSIDHRSGKSQEKMYTLLEMPDHKLLMGGSSHNNQFRCNDYIEEGWLVELDVKPAGNNEEIDLILIDVKNDKVIHKITPENNVIDLADGIFTDTFSLILEPLVEDIGIIDLKLNGPVQIEKSIQKPPYVIFELDSNGLTFPKGDYSLEFTYYCDAVDLTGFTKTFTFKIIDTREFQLFNADDDTFIQVLQEGDLINLDQIGTNNLSLVFGNTTNRPDSVFMDLKGTQSDHQKWERFRPYALFGDAPNFNYYGRNFCPGNYTITATSYEEGRKITPLQVNFQVVGGSDLDIKSLTLINADNNQDIAPLGTTTITTDQAISIRANTDRCVESVRFVLKDNQGLILLEQTENITPYALLGDTPRRNYLPWLPNAGKYTLEVTAFSDEKASGVAGDTKVVEFEVVEAQSNATQTVQPSWMTIYPNPNSGETVQIQFEKEFEGQKILRLMDRQGYVILSKIIKEKNIDLNIRSLKTGFYLFELQTDEGIFRKTFIRH